MMKHDPYVAVIGTMDSMDDCMLISDQKIVCWISSCHSGVGVVSIVVLLMAFCHTFNLKFSDEVAEAMEFLQFKLLGLSERKKRSISFQNILRAVALEEEQVIRV